MLAANIVLSIGIIALMALAVYIVTHYMKLTSEVEVKMQELEMKEANLARRKNELDLWESQLLYQTQLSSKTVHAYANKTIEDAGNEAPDKPIRSTYKQLASQLGYSVLNSFKGEIVRSHDNGKTRYSIDLNIFPYNIK